MHLLLLQFRPDAAIADHEHGLISAQLAHKEHVLTRWNALESLPSIEEAMGFDALLVGGSGDYLVSQGDIPEVVQNVAVFLRALREKRMPMLGICFGAQLMTHAFGGEVTLDAARQETGTFLVTRTDASEHDPLFSQLPKTFDAQFGHKDHLTTLPPGAVNFATTDLSPHQAFTFPGEPVYAVLFHPELNEEAILSRLEYYEGIYGSSPEKREALRQVLRPTPVASETIPLFLERIVREGKRYPLL